LPKTASTTLQMVHFPRLQPPLAYAGKYYDDSGRRNDVVFDHVRSKVQAGGQVKAAKLRDAIDWSAYQSVEDILVSDEMFVVDTAASTWQQKIERLAKNI